MSTKNETTEMLTVLLLAYKKAPKTSQWVNPSQQEVRAFRTALLLESQRRKEGNSFAKDVLQTIAHVHLVRMGEIMMETKRVYDNLMSGEQ